MRCAKREPGRSWEAIGSELRRLGDALLPTFLLDWMELPHEVPCLGQVYGRLPLAHIMHCYRHPLVDMAAAADKGGPPQSSHRSHPTANAQRQQAHTRRDKGAGRTLPTSFPHCLSMLTLSNSIRSLVTPDMLVSGRACGQASKRRAVAPAGADADSMGEVEIWQQILRLLHAARKKLGAHLTAFSCSFK